MKSVFKYQKILFQIKIKKMSKFVEIIELCIPRKMTFVRIKFMKILKKTW